MSTSSNDGHYQRLLNRSPAGVVITSYEGEVLAANLSAAAALGFDDPDELIGTDIRSRYRDRGDREELLADVRREGVVRHRELAMVGREGTEKYLLVSVQEENHPEYGKDALLTTWVDVTEQRMLREELEHLARHDDLTDLLNRRALYERSEQVLAMCDREDRRAAVLYVDIAGFRAINEQVGHQGGDEILAAVGQRLKDTMRDADLVARLGGDEFVVVATLLRDEGDADQVGRRLMYAFEEPFQGAGVPLQLQAAVGVSVFPDDGGDIDTLLHRADQALWGPEREKSAGVRRYARTVEGQDAAPAWNVARELNRALQSGDELLQFYQPIVTAEDGEVIGLESLVRWKHPERGVLTPGAFVPEAEASGLIRQLDRVVFRDTVRQTAEWVEAGMSARWVSVNLSAQTLSDPDCVEWAHRVLEQHAPLRPGHLVIEITEHTAMRQVSRTDTLERLQSDVGVSISIDDFGIGYSSLLYLREFPADYLKIDMQFVRNVVENDPDQKVVEGIIALGEAFDLELVAEGVETEGQAAWLRDAGCHFLQGYLYGRPARPTALEWSVDG